jgi:hypothetical protein
MALGGIAGAMLMCGLSLMYGFEMDEYLRFAEQTVKHSKSVALLGSFAAAAGAMGLFIRTKKPAAFVFLVVPVAILWGLWGFRKMQYEERSGAVEEDRQQRTRRATAQQQTAERAAAFCDQQAPVIGARPYAPGPVGAPHRVVVADFGQPARGETEARWRPASDLLPSAWMAESVDAIELIVCVQRHSNVVESCRYEDSSGSPMTLTRREGFATVRIYAAQSGLQIHEQVLSGGTPPPCPSGFRYGDGHRVSSTVSNGAIREAARAAVGVPSPGGASP